MNNCNLEYEDAIHIAVATRKEIKQIIPTDNIPKKMFKTLLPDYPYQNNKSKLD